MSEPLTREERDIIHSTGPRESPLPDWKYVCDRLLADLERVEAERDSLERDNAEMSSAWEDEQARAEKAEAARDSLAESLRVAVARIERVEAERDEARCELAMAERCRANGELEFWECRARMERAEADLMEQRSKNAEMFAALEDQTTKALQMAGKWQKAEARLARVVEAMEHALEWLEEEGCDCGTDEPNTCALCHAKAVLAAAKEER